MHVDSIVGRGVLPGDPLDAAVLTPRRFGKLGVVASPLTWALQRNMSAESLAGRDEKVVTSCVGGSRYLKNLTFQDHSTKLTWSCSLESFSSYEAQVQQISCIESRSSPQGIPSLLFVKDTSDSMETNITNFSRS